MVTGSSGPSPVGGQQKGVATGYTVVLPPGWARLPLRQGTDGAIDAVADAATLGGPRDQVAALRAELRRRLRSLAARAREGAGLDLYLPTEKVGEAVLTCSFVVSETLAPGPEESDPAVQLVRLLAREGSRPVELPSALAVRSERRVDGDGHGGEVQNGLRRVEYVLPVPHGRGRWVIVAFSALGAGDPGDGYADLQVELFDAIMTTFRWATA